MTVNKISTAEALRQRAEALLAQSPETFQNADVKSVKELAHELAVHQAELDLQNETLRETQLALQEARDRFIALYQHAPVGYVVLDGAGIVRQTNATWLTMLHRPEEDFRGRPFTEALVTEDVPIFLARFRSFFRNPLEKQIVLRVKRKEADPFYARIEARPRDLLNMDGTEKESDRTELMVIVSDISDLHEAHQQIKRQNQQLQQANEREKRLNAVLAAIRNVNQLITKEDDQGRLIQGACSSLTEDLSYYSAWIALLDPTGLSITAMAQAGFEKGYAVFGQCLAGAQVPACMTQAMAHDEPVVVMDTKILCVDCPVSRGYKGHTGLIHRLTYGEKTYGILGVSVPGAYASDSEEQSLFKELAGDLAFALHKIDMKRSLDDSRRRYREIFQGSRDGFVMVDIEGRIIDANQAYCDMLGYSLEELRAMEDFYRITPERWREWEAREIWEKRLLGQGYSGVYEKEYIRKDGEVFPVELCSYAVRREDGIIDYLWGTARDITRRKKSEEAIRRNANRLQFVVDILQFPAENVQEFLDDALDKAIILTNSKVGYIYFYDEDRREFMLNSWSKDVMKECTLLDPQTTYELDKTGIWGEAVRQRKPILINAFQEDHPLKKGYPEGHVSLSRFLTLPIFHQQRIVAVIGVANKSTEYDQTDILELTLLMDSVWKSVEHMKSDERITLLGQMLDEAPAAITIHDTTGRFLYANRQTVRLHGYENEAAFLAVSLHDLDVPESAQLIAERLRQINEKGEARFEVVHFRKDGTTFPLEVLAKKIEWHGQPAILSVADDITEQKRSSEEQEKLHDQLAQAQKMESVGRLAGGVAHDFNNMLAVILGHTEIGLMEAGSNESLHRRLLQMQETAKRSADLVRQLLAFARKQTISPMVLDLNETVEGMLKMLRRLIGEDISLIWMPGSDLWPIKMDPSQIDQILANLCVNARDAIRDVGNVTIETQRATLDHAYCAGRAGFVPGEYVLLAVSDDGCGMDRETLNKIFEPFFTTKEVGKGTGLGLPTVYGIVKQNNGFINVYSEPNQGTTFKIYLPRHQGKQVQASREDGPEPMQRGNEKVLLVEDDPMLLDMGKDMLEALGYDVLKAGHPEEAIQIANEETKAVHLLITDVVMPGMNGRDLASHLQPLHPDLKCLFMSGYTADFIAHHGVLEEGVHFIQKPFTMQDLAAKVREVLDQ